MQTASVKRGIQMYQLFTCFNVLSRAVFKYSEDSLDEEAEAEDASLRCSCGENSLVVDTKKGSQEGGRGDLGTEGSTDELLPAAVTLDIDPKFTGR